MAKPIPDRYHTVTPCLTLRGGAQAIELYKKAFGAVEHVCMPGPDGKSLMLWRLGTHKEDLAPDEIARRQQQFFASMSAKK
jgi:uncharacterized glyoxalase superfamily protein PhnB